MKKTKSPAGRKPLPDKHKKRQICVYIDGETIDRNGGVEEVRRKMLESLINSITLPSYEQERSAFPSLQTPKRSH